MDITLFPKEVQDRVHEILAMGLRRKIVRLEAEKKNKNRKLTNRNIQG